MNAWAAWYLIAQIKEFLVNTGRQILIVWLSKYPSAQFWHEDVGIYADILMHMNV